MFRTILAFTIAPLLAMAVAAPALADGVRVHGAAARMVVIPENRRDVSVSISGGDSRLPTLRTHTEGNTVIVDGGLERRIAGCGSFGVNLGWFHRRAGEGPSPVQRVDVRGVGPLSVERLPVITVRVPMNADVSADGAVWGEVGPTDALRLDASGCGDWRLGDVRGPLDLSTSGAGDVSARNAGGLHAHMSGSGDLAMGDVARDAEVAMSGSGDVKLGRVGGRLNARVAGSGNVGVGRIDGPVDAAIRGSGDVRVHDGASPTVAVSVAGSGNFSYGGVAGTLNAQVAGSGDVTVARVTGPVAKSVAGSGEVHVGRGG